MRSIPLAICALGLLVLAGCESITRIGSDSFEAAGVPTQKFENDAMACRQKGVDAITFDVRLVAGTSYARNRAFNGIYRACMTAKGYAPRPYIKNFLPA